MEEILERCSFMIFLWAIKTLAVFQKLSVGVTQRKRQFDCHTFPKELMVLKGSQFYKHIPSLSVWLVKHFTLPVSVSQTLCVKMSSQMKISYWGSSCPSPPCISSSHSNLLHVLYLMKSLWYRLNTNHACSFFYLYTFWIIITSILGHQWFQ